MASTPEDLFDAIEAGDDARVKTLLEADPALASNRDTSGGSALMRALYRFDKPLIATLNAPATETRPATTKWQQIVDTVLVPTLQKAVAGGDSATLLSEAKKKVQDLIK